MMKDDKKTIIKTVIVCLIVLFFTFPKYSGFLLGPVLLILIPSLLVNLYFIFFKKKEQKRRIIQIVLWSFTCLISLTHHIYLHKNTRNLDQDIANSVMAYKEKNDDYPKTDEALASYDKKVLREYFFIYKYPNEVRPYPLLIYQKTWMPFDSYSFDFKTKQWENN